MEPAVVLAESGGESKADAPPRPKDPDVKAKESEPKLKEQESRPKESDTKPVEQKQKEPEVKAKESEPKAKDGEGKAKEPDAKPKEADAKPKEGPKPKESEHKGKESEQKPKETELKANKEVEPIPERPCPSPQHATEAKLSTEGPAPAGEGTGDRAKSPEPEAKKPMRSSMVTAKLALMADPRLFPYDIEVDMKDKDLVLLGKVAQESDKRVATDIVRCLEGVHAVENRLKVETDATHGLMAERDKVLTQLVKERFEKSKTLQSVKFDVKTEDGVVTLSGTTRFQIIVLEAAQAARQVPGVRAVNTEGVRLVAGE